MHRPGMNPDNVQMTDILCDFCLSPWNEEGYFIEGHQGSVICGKCLAVAYIEVMGEGVGVGDDKKCTMCLEERSESGWRSPVNEQAFICKRCIKLAANTLSKDPDSDWEVPAV